MADDNIDEPVVRAAAHELVTVQITYRKTGVRGATDPHGYVKLELRQPRSTRRSWEDARQFAVAALPAAPNVNIVFDGQLIKPRTAGEVRPEPDGLEMTDVSDVAGLEARRESLRMDIARLQAHHDALLEAHIRTRKSHADEIEEAGKLLAALRASYRDEGAQVHERMLANLEAETRLAAGLKERVTKYEDDLREAVNRESKLANVAADLVEEQRAKGQGTLPERLLDRAAGHFTDFATSKVGAELFTKLLSKL